MHTRFSADTDSRKNSAPPWENGCLRIPNLSMLHDFKAHIPFDRIGRINALHLLRFYKCGYLQVQWTQEGNT